MPDFSGATDRDDIVLARLPRQRLSETRPLKENSSHYAILAVLCSKDANPPDDCQHLARLPIVNLPVALTRPSLLNKTSTRMLLNFTPDDVAQEQNLLASVVPTLSDIEAIPRNHMHARSIGGQPNLHVDHEEIDGVEDFLAANGIIKDWNLGLL